MLSAADPAVRARFAELGAGPLATAPEELSHFISAEIAKWRDNTTKAGIKLDPRAVKKPLAGKARQ